MNKKVKILLIVISITVFFYIGYYFINRDNNLINITSLSKEFVDTYYNELSRIDSNDKKDNMLIVISPKKIKNTYGASNIIEAPNNQYILQYDSKELKDKALLELKNDKHIKSVEENETTELFESSGTSESNYNSWGIEKMSLNTASDFANSQELNNVNVAIIDTGLDVLLFNKYYSSKLSGTYNVLDNSTSLEDTDGHGTHIAGTIAESTPNNVKILPIKVSTNGTMYITDIVAAINYIVYNKNADVINMSFGSYYNSESLEQAIVSANSNNIICVAAAGNENTSRLSYPASYDTTISVSSIDSELNRSSFSNYGSKITFAAPGTNIKSIMGKNTDISIKNGNNDDDDHEIISGTSMATPHVVSAVAMLKSYNKDLTLENTIDILKEKTIDLGDPGWDKYYGYGLISFENVEFCDKTYCDEFGIFKDTNKHITGFELNELIFTKYNYYSITNLLASKINITYNDNSSEIMSLGDISNLKVLNYDSTISHKQTVTLNVDDINLDIEVTNPIDYLSGWEYNVLEGDTIEITGYKSHDLNIKKLYIPETIDSKNITSFVDNIKFSEMSHDFDNYEYLYLPEKFGKIGNYNFINSKIKYLEGDSKSVSIGSHSFESSSIIKIDIPVSDVADYAFKDCLELLYINIIGNSTSKTATIGDYAFYNCKKLEKVLSTSGANITSLGNYVFYDNISLSTFEIDMYDNIGDYAFYNTQSLLALELGYASSFGKYAFYGSGIYEIDLSYRLEEINESTFENCKNLQKVSFTAGKIGSRAFYNSNIKYISFSDVDYISEDAFAYNPISNGNTTASDSKVYSFIYGVGIYEVATNKLIIGFSGKSTTKKSVEIPDYITEIGNYAFTGNSDLKEVSISSSVTKIGDYAFMDCYQLSNIYLLGNDVTFGNETFKRLYEGEIQSDNLNIYVYKDSQAKQLVESNGLNYRHYEPDKYEILNMKDKYVAKKYITGEDVPIIKLTYNEKEVREEIVSDETFANGPISTGHALNLEYENSNSGLQYGDTYIILNIKNSLGYVVASDEKVPIVVVKATPVYTIPKNITANVGQKLSEIVLPDNFEWMDKDEIISETGSVIYKAKYIPNDTKNYEIVENIEIPVLVESSKTIIIPNISISNKIYDGTNNINISNINITNIDKNDYTIVSAIIENANVGEQIAVVKLRLTDDKFLLYSFENNEQEMEFRISFNIDKTDIDLEDLSKDVQVTYDNDYHSIDINIKSNLNFVIKYCGENGEYNLDDLPKYKDVGSYIIKYRVSIDNNYNDYYGQKTLTINDNVTYIIEKYRVIEDSHYISRIMPNTTKDEFTSNIKLGTNYSVNIETIKLEDKDLLYTGSKTSIHRGSNVYADYINIVIGDIDGDAEVTSSDLLKARQHLIGTKVLGGIYLLSADIDDDAEITSSDLLRIRQHLIGTKAIS